VNDEMNDFVGNILQNTFYACCYILLYKYTPMHTYLRHCYATLLLMKLVGYQLPTCLCVKMEFVVGTISLSCELCSLSKAAFVHVGPAQLCTENSISIYMCSAVKVAWLAQNFRRNSTRV